VLDLTGVRRRGQGQAADHGDDARRLLDQGFEVTLQPVTPLAKDRVMSDAKARNWFEEQVKGLPRQGGQ
jgi:hypothetical protein